MFSHGMTPKQTSYVESVQSFIKLQVNVVSQRLGPILAQMRGQSVSPSVAGSPKSTRASVANYRINDGNNEQPPSDLIDLILN